MREPVSRAAVGGVEDDEGAVEAALAGARRGRRAGARRAVWVWRAWGVVVAGGWRCGGGGGLRRDARPSGAAAGLVRCVGLRGFAARGRWAPGAAGRRRSPAEPARAEGRARRSVSERQMSGEGQAVARRLGRACGGYDADCNGLDARLRCRRQCDSVNLARHEGLRGRLRNGVHRATAWSRWTATRARRSCGYLCAGAVKLNKKDSTAQRLAQVYAELTALMEMWEPEMVAIEDVFFSANAKSGAEAGAGARRGDAGGGELRACRWRSMLRCRSRARWWAMGWRRRSRCSLWWLGCWSWSEAPKPADAADALAIAICHIHHAQTAEGLRR